MKEALAFHVLDHFGNGRRVLANHDEIEISDRAIVLDAHFFDCDSRDAHIAGHH